MDFEKLRGAYKGECWLVCGGPSVRGFDFSQLNGYVATINEIGLDCPHDFWFGNDRLEELPARHWQTDSIKLLRKYVTHRPSGRNICYYPEDAMNRFLDPDAYFDGDGVVWGMPTFINGGIAVKKSVMVLAIGALYRMGFRQIKLLGADFSIGEGVYGHSHKAIDSDVIRHCTQAYSNMLQWFTHLLPAMKRRKFKIYNCTQGGGLWIFERREWQEMNGENLKIREPLAMIDR